ncbi:hypothetical protein [Roseimaritima ulvae]|uniref:Uncharacterized protein n=1 Tax=Roseimaritima ulvae TaxID=980254 RepID=A0A5B9QZX5_9BACT|nr:hypothetical protein [Roseimaritima ulvae]QEG43490.1 hypothetical protein UC8_55400 [Roseimaritima ulvae]
MSFDRRPQLAQRRRRIIYAHGLGTSDRVSPAATAASRQARRPTAAYGARVHRRLRARWFGLVPVRRRSLSLAIAVVATAATLLSLGHGAALRWAPLAYAPEIARPLRLDRPDSFGNWLGTLLLLTSAGAAFLIYQLRRYRSDDYQGRYRIWRPVILLLAVAGLDAVTGLVDWCGHLLDAGLGERKALSGGDWIRLSLTIGGTALYLRLLAEVWRSRVASIALTLTALAMAYPTLVHWKILQIDSPLTSTLHSAAPLWARTAIWVAMLAYLRMLYRDVRQIDAHDRLADRMRNLKLVRLWNSEADDEPSETDAKTAAKTKRASARAATASPGEPQAKRNAGKRTAEPDRRKNSKHAKDSEDEKDLQDSGDGDESQPDRPKRRWFGLRKPAATDPQDSDEEQPDEPADDAQAAEQEDQPDRPKRRWFRLRKPAATDPQDGDEDQSDEQSDDAQAAEQEDQPDRPKRRWFGLRKPAATAPQDSDEDQSDEQSDDAQAAEQEDQPARPKRRWFGLRKPAATDPQNGDEDQPDEQSDDRDDAPQSQSARPAATSRQDAAPAAPPQRVADGEQELDPDTIDWSSLNKSERRRLRRELKRQGKAA